MSKSLIPLFTLGDVVAAPAALAALEDAGQPPVDFLGRHVTGDWGNVDAEDKAANDEAVSPHENPEDDGRVLSSYQTAKGGRSLPRRRGKRKD